MKTQTRVVQLQAGSVLGIGSLMTHLVAILSMDTAVYNNRTVPMYMTRPLKTDC